MHLDESEEKEAINANNNFKEEIKTSSSKWINNQGEEVEEVFGFNDNAELVNGRAAMIGFAMLILTELAFSGDPVVKTIFGVN